MAVAKTGEVAWYVTGRFYTDPSGNLFDVGYFLNIQGIDGGLFDDAISEKEAYFTFAAAPFAGPSIENGGLTIGVDAQGTFNVYLLDPPGASFEKTNSFSAGLCIATFSRVAIVPTTKIGIGKNATLLSNVFSAKLIGSQPFEHRGVRYDFAEFVGYGITQWGTAAAGASSANGVPFVGSAIRIG